MTCGYKTSRCYFNSMEHGITRHVGVCEMVVTVLKNVHFLHFYLFIRIHFGCLFFGNINL